MCIGSISVNQAQDLMFVTKFEDFPNSLLPTAHCRSQHGASQPDHVNQSFSDHGMLCIL